MVEDNHHHGARAQENGQAVEVAVGDHGRRFVEDAIDSSASRIAMEWKFAQEKQVLDLWHEKWWFDGAEEGRRVAG